MRDQWGFHKDATILYQFKDDSRLKADIDYKDAKSGDLTSAINLADRLVWKKSVRLACETFSNKADFLLPVVAEELQGDNAIPLALSAAYSVGLNIPINIESFQCNKAFHTGADPMERLVARAVFDGKIFENKRYVIIDDVTTMCSTLADLASHVVNNGGIVVGAIVLASSSRSGELTPRKKDINIIQERYYETVKELFSIEPSALTYDEAFYLAGFRNADELRARAVKAENEREIRIASKALSKS